jgi:hypothetical protein
MKMLNYSLDIGWSRRSNTGDQGHQGCARVLLQRGSQVVVAPGLLSAASRGGGQTGRGAGMHGNGVGAREQHKWRPKESVNNQNKK